MGDDIYEFMSEGELDSLNVKARLCITKMSWLKIVIFDNDKVVS